MTAVVRQAAAAVAADNRISSESASAAAASAAAASAAEASALAAEVGRLKAELAAGEEARSAVVQQV